MAPTLANKKTTETQDTPLRLSQTSPRTSAMLHVHVMQVLLGCLPIRTQRKELKSPGHNPEATATHQDPRCGGGAQAVSIQTYGLASEAAFRKLRSLTMTFCSDSQLDSATNAANTTAEKHVTRAAVTRVSVQSFFTRARCGSLSGARPWSRTGPVSLSQP
jgi:hypothetical protein